MCAHPARIFCLLGDLLEVSVQFRAFITGGNPD